MSHTKTINFESQGQYAATNDLLRRVGFVVDLDEFLVEHLAGVLQKQSPNTEIELIELLGIDGCGLGGMLEPDSTVMLADNLSIPLTVALVVNVDSQLAMLKLRVVIRVKGENVKYTGFDTDVFVLEQMNL